MSPEQVEILILGSGQGGKLLAWEMARSGRRTAVIERRWVGGSCPNVACMPSKNVIWGARVAHLVRNAGQFGIATGSVTVDMASVRRRKAEMVSRDIDLHLQNYQATGAELIMGSGSFIGPRTIEVRLNEGGTRVLAGERMFLNVGTHAAIPDVPGLAAATPLSHIEALELDYLPAHLIVLGGGYVGLEMAQACRRFGGRVTIIEPGPQILSREDADVAAELQRILADDGIRFVLAAEALRVHDRSGESVAVTVRTASGEETVEGSDILVAVGRIPNTAGIGLAARVAKLPLSAVLRTQATGETQGFMKALIGADDRILGFTMIGSEAGEVMAVVQTAMLAALPYQRLRDAVIAHLTMAEGLGPPLANVPAL